MSSHSSTPPTDTHDAATTAHGNHTSHGGIHTHVVPLPILLAVWAALLVLTYATVAVTSIDLGPLNLWLAMAIATVKASLVVLYFMHLRYDKPFNAVVLICALLFVMLFVGIALTDSVQYQPQVEQYRYDVRSNE